MKPIIDVSQHQGVFKWNNYKSKISGAIIRCGYGKDMTSQDDKQFKRNVSECERLGIPFGVYLYSYAKDKLSARLEAIHVERLIKGLNFSLPIYYDIEEVAYAKNARENFYAFKKQLGNDYRVGLYTGEYFYNAYLTDVSCSYLWIAKYGTNNGTEQKQPVLKDGAQYQLWQYTSKWGTNKIDASKVIDASIFIKYKLKSIFEVALEVIDGKWGNGTTRKNRLTSAGYDYNTVQYEVNIILIAKDVIAGKYGTGTARKQALSKKGYDYTTVQQMVNKLLITGNK